MTPKVPRPRLSNSLEAGSYVPSCAIFCPWFPPLSLQGPKTTLPPSAPGPTTLRSRRGGRAPGATRATHPGALGQVIPAQRVVKVEAHHVAGGQGEVLSHGCAAEGAETGRLVQRVGRNCQDPTSQARREEAGQGGVGGA